MSKRYFWSCMCISIVFVISYACNVTEDERGLVKYKGALKNMMRKGDISAKANLADLENQQHLYALGALENLKGEIQIFDSKPYITSVSDDSLVFDNSMSQKATLLLYANIEKWISRRIPDEVSSMENLEKYVEQVAVEYLIDTKHPFPFLIKGNAKSFDWHVINWKDGDTEHSHEKHINSGLNGTIEDKMVELLGFYSDSHRGIFTHHTTNMHIHFKTVDNTVAGHIDDLTLGPGMIIYLPEIK